MEICVAVSWASFIVFLRQNVVCRCGASEIDAGLRRRDCFDSTGLSAPVAHQSWPCAKKVDAEIGFDKAVKIACGMRYDA
jgi:hypothetical protein